jgi:poly-gamma-glutamate synthesis protein (capsule biosynthesis protein)
VVRAADITFGNLENPISLRGEDQGSKYSFRARPEAIEGLAFAGFDVLSLANNHIWDWGRDALEDTILLLRQSGIASVGAGLNVQDANEPVILVANDLRIGYLAYTNLYPASLRAGEAYVGVSRFAPVYIGEQIRKTDAESDIVVVSLHWGEEYAPHPEAWQRELAYNLVDAGADLIIGHHPHVVQDTEWYNGAFIAYSLGNFVFDQYFSEATTNGLMLRVTVTRDGVAEVEEVPVHINDAFQPELIVP